MKKNILFIASTDPRDTSCGMAQRTHRLWKRYLNEGNVYTLIIVGRNEKTGIMDVENKIATINPASSFFLFSAFHALIRRLFAPSEWPFRNFARIKNIFPWKEIDFDFVVVRYLSPVARLQAWNFAPVHVDVDDLPSQSSRTVWSKKWFWPFRFIPKYFVEKWERYILSKCDFAYVTNEDDCNYVSRFCKTEIFYNEALPPKVGYMPFGKIKDILLTVGKFDYYPNIEGVEWFVKNVWANIRKKYPSLRYRIAGKGLPANHPILKVDGVDYVGFVEDIDKEYEQAKAVVAPIFSGAGTCIKVLEAISRQKTVFATSFAVRGLRNGEKASSLFVSDKPLEMYDEIVSFLEGQYFVEEN